MLTQQQINDKWTEIKAGVRNIWGEISDSELDEIHGNISLIPNLVRKKYLQTNGDISRNLKLLMDSFDNETDKGHLLNNGISSYHRSPINSEPLNQTH
jgi:hypothetical protein